MLPNHLQILVINQQWLDHVAEVTEDGTFLNKMDVADSFTLAGVKEMKIILSMSAHVWSLVQNLHRKKFVSYPKPKDHVSVSTLDGITTTLIQPVRNSLTLDVKETRIVSWIATIVKKLAIQQELLFQPIFAPSQ